MIDAPWYVDSILMSVMIGAALVQYIWIAFKGHSVGRWLQAVGFTGLAMRMGYALYVDGNVPIASASVPFLMCLAGGTVLTAWKEILQKPLPEVHCLQEPDRLCQREDRIRAAILERKK